MIALPGHFLPELSAGFQKILTSVKNKDFIEDEIKIQDESRTRTYSRWKRSSTSSTGSSTPCSRPRFLEWLASVVALELMPNWTVAEQRKMIARIVQISHRIGLKAGLYDFLDIYAREAIRPRVSIDDSEAVSASCCAATARLRSTYWHSLSLRPGNEGIDLQLMPFARQKSEIPSPGNNLLIVASVKEQPNSNAKLYIRFRDRAGKLWTRRRKT